MRALVYVVPIALAIYALFDLARSLPEERAGVQPWAWVLAILLLPVLGPVVWLFVSRSASPRPRPDAPRGPFRPPTRPSGPVAPDDDPDFLWRLEQERRRADPPADEPPA